MFWETSIILKTILVGQVKGEAAFLTHLGYGRELILALATLVQTTLANEGFCKDNLETYLTFVFFLMSRTS